MLVDFAKNLAGIANSNYIGGQVLRHHAACANDDILAVELWANSLPRKILGYKTPDEAFEAEMDAIYSA